MIFQIGEVGLGGGRSLEIFNSKKQQFRINSLYAIKSLEIKVYFFQSLMILSWMTLKQKYKDAYYNKYNDD